MNLLGKEGEQLVAKYLKETKKYKVIDTNYYCGEFGEIDIICVDKDGRYIFVEVKSRSSDKFMDINQAVNFRKKQALKHATLFYISNNNLHNKSFRIDLATYNKYTGNIEYFEDVLDS